MKIAFRTLVFVFPILFSLSIDFVDHTPPKITFVSEAEAIVGAPFSPVSVAGVARRTTRRVVATTAVVQTSSAAAASAPKPAAPPPQPVTQTASAVPLGTVVYTLPDGCTSVAVSGVSYSDCGGVFYKAAFQGNNLVYVVVEKPMK
jgi:hypothetical protein